MLSLPTVAVTMVDAGAHIAAGSSDHHREGCWVAHLPAGKSTPSFLHSFLPSFFHPPTHPSMHLSTHSPIYPSHLSIHPSTHPFIHPSIHLSTQPTTHLSIHPPSTYPMHPFTYPPRKNCQVLWCSRVKATETLTLAAYI